VRCSCKAGEDAERLQRISGLNAEERKIKLADIEIASRPATVEMVKSCELFLKEPFGFLTLWGGPGNAKTMALQAVVNDLLNCRRSAVYVTAFDLISFIRSAFDGQRNVMNDNAYERLLRFERVDVLAIDEFDKLRVTDWVMEQLTDLIDRRYRGGISGLSGTLIAMNSDPKEQNEWIASRLFDGRNRVIHNTDSDIRSKLER